MRSAVTIDSDACDNTQACLAVCPDDVFELAEGTISVARANQCSFCMRCVENCPQGAVEVDY